MKNQWHSKDFAGIVRGITNHPPLTIPLETNLPPDILLDPLKNQQIFPLAQSLARKAKSTIKNMGNFTKNHFGES